MYLKRPYILRHSAIRPLYPSVAGTWFKHVLNREEKSLRHVAMVAKFLDDDKPKTSLKK